MIPIVRWLEIIFLREEIDFKKPWVFLRLMRNLTSQSCRRPSNCLVWNPEVVKRLVYPRVKLVSWIPTWCCFYHFWASLVAQRVKNPPALWETWLWSLGWEDSLEKGMATHSSIVAWRSPSGHKELDFTHTTALSGFSSVKADIQDVPTLCWIVDRQICSVHGSEACVLDRSEMDTYRFC